MPAPSHHHPLDDLEPLRDLVGEARVVAISEDSHFITEFSLLRRRFPLAPWAQREGPAPPKPTTGRPTSC